MLSIVPDSCSSYFFLPMFPECDLFLEAIPCFNDTQTVFVTMATPSGQKIHSFYVTFGGVAKVNLSAINKGRREGTLVRLVTLHGDVFQGLLQTCPGRIVAATFSCYGLKIFCISELLHNMYSMENKLSKTSEPDMVHQDTDFKQKLRCLLNLG